MHRGCPYHEGFGNGDAHITVTPADNPARDRPQDWWMAGRSLSKESK